MCRAVVSAAREIQIKPWSHADRGGEHCIKQGYCSVGSSHPVATSAKLSGIPTGLGWRGEAAGRSGVGLGWGVLSRGGDGDAEPMAATFREHNES